MVSCHNLRKTLRVLLQCVLIKVFIMGNVLLIVTAKSLQLCPTLGTVACQTPVSMDSPGKNTAVSCDALLQEILP